MTDRPRDPLAHTTRLIVDGTNLLHAMSRGPERQPSAALIGRLRAIIPAPIAIELVFDGPPEPGLRGERIASGIRVRYSGARSADSVILTMVDEAGLANAEATGAILVVSDDRDLRNRLRVRGARTAGASWLLGRLDRGRLAAPSSGNRAPPRGAVEDTDERPRWRPGRRATVKRGPSRRCQRGDTP